MTLFATVSAPKTEEAQTQYLVTVHRSDVETSSSADPEQSEVYHRYSDFQWLYERLIKERRGAVIPIAGLRFGIAAKAGVGAMHGAGNVDDTVAGRCRRLDAFMRESVSANPELVGAPSLDVFLANGTGAEFDAAKAKVETEADASGDELSDDEQSGGGGAAKAGDDAGSVASATTSPPPKSAPKAKRTGFRQYVAKTVAKTATAVAASRGKTKLHETADEERIKIATQYVKDLDVQVKAMAHQASVLSRSGMDTATAWTDFGRASGVWAEVLKSRRTLEETGGPKIMREGKTDVRGSVSVTVTDEKVDDVAAAADSPSRDSTCVRLGTIDGLSTKAAVKIREAEKEGKEKFADSVQDLTAIVSALTVALRKRGNCQIYCTTRLQHAAKLSSAQSSSAESKAAKAKAEKEADEAKEELEQATQRFLREMERVDADLDRRLCRAVGEYAQLQLMKAEGMREVWTEMVNVGSSVVESGEGHTDDDGDKEEQCGTEEEVVKPPMPSSPPPPEPSSPPPPEPSAPPLE